MFWGGGFFNMFETLPIYISHLIKTLTIQVALLFDGPGGLLGPRTHPNNKWNNKKI